MLEKTDLSPTAVRCLDRQLAEALDLAVWCYHLSDPARCDGDRLMVVVLERLASDLTDLAGAIVPLVGDHGGTIPPLPAHPSSRTDTWVAQLDDDLRQVGMVARLDAMTPGLETSVVRLLSKIAALYQSSRELLLTSLGRAGA